LSVGGGAFFGSDFGGGLVGGKYSSSESMYGVTVKAEAEQSAPWFGGGINAFFDVQYAEVGLGITFASATWKSEYSVTVEGSVAGVDMSYLNQSQKSEFSVSSTLFNIGLLLKYPIDLGSMSVFPAAGIDYAACLSMKDENGHSNDDAGDASALWIKFGAGLDFSLSESMFLRSVLLYGIRMENKAESDLIKEAPGAESIMGHGLTIRVGVGFKL